MDPIITITADNNGDGSSIAINAGFTEVWSDGNAIYIQCSDVMAFDDGHGDPITGVTIELTFDAAADWIKQMQDTLAAQGRGEQEGESR